MWMMAALAFTVLTGFLLITGLPVMLIRAMVEWLHKRNLTPLFGFFYVAGGLAIGLAVAWSFVVIHEGWHLSFTETFYACYHSDIYGNAIEGAAEDYFFFTLFFGDVGAILTGFVGWLVTRRRRRIALSY